MRRNVVELLKEYLRVLLPIIFANNGTVDKFMGDAVLVTKLNESLEQRRARYRHFGIGIHCGEVVHGFVGTSDRISLKSAPTPARPATSTKRENRTRRCAGISPSEEIADRHCASSFHVGPLLERYLARPRAILRKLALLFDQKEQSVRVAEQPRGFQNGPDAQGSAPPRPEVFRNPAPHRDKQPPAINLRQQKETGRVLLGPEFLFADQFRAG
jgi:hypothetical protein